MADHPPIIEFKNVSCHLGDRLAINNVSFSLSHGESLCLLGASGCGKSTSLRLAAGLESLQQGEIFMDGERVSSVSNSLPPEHRKIGFLFQDFALFPHLTVWENICFGLHHYEAPVREEKATYLLEAVNMQAYRDRYPHSLSGGEQQRVGLARALAPEPQLILMDEPFSNLDPQLREDMRDLTADILRKFEASSLIVTHDIDDAMRLADRIAVLHEGQLRQCDTPEMIYKSPKDLRVARILGELNVFPVRIKNGQMDMIFSAPHPRLTLADGAYSLALRPHHIHCGEGAFAFEADLQIKRYLGTGWLCELILPDEQCVSLVVSSQTPPKQGAQIFNVNRDAIMLFEDSD